MNDAFIAANGTTYVGWEDEVFNESPCFINGGFGNGNNTITMTREDGGSFDLLRIDVAEWDVFSGGGEQRFLLVQGFRDGTQVAEQSLELDMVADGVGPLDDFETFVLDGAFRELTSVRFDNQGTFPNRAGQMAIDNIVVPEPTIVPLLATALAALASRVREGSECGLLT